MLLAREQLRRMPRNRSWLVGVRIDPCQVPDDPIGAGERIGDLQFVDVPALGWGLALDRLLRAVGVVDPKLPGGNPLGAGLPGQIKVVGGGIVFSGCTTNIGPMDSLRAFDGMKFHVSDGVCGRASDGSLAVYLTSDAPNVHLQAINEQVGLYALLARSFASHLSNDPKSPTLFRSNRRHVMKCGDLSFDIATGGTRRLDYDLPVEISYEVFGYLAGGQFNGRFTSNLDYGPFNAAPGFKGDLISSLRVVLQGTCELRFEPDQGPPADFAQLEAALGRPVVSA